MIWIVGVVALLILLALAAAYVCCQLAFGVRAKAGEDIFRLPKGEQYTVHQERSTAMIKIAAEIPYEDVWITSHDGLKLHGKYYHAADNAPLQIMFHGYRSAAVRDFCGGLQEALKMGYNVLLVDQRAHGKSEGKYLTFGVKERYDCLAWVQYAVERLDPDTRILLYGMSMGAATVLMAAGLPLPKNVIGIVADCGYTAPPEILQKVVGEMGYPVRLVYPLIRLGGRVYAGFDTKAASAAEAMEHCTLPVLFIHGEDDRFVPCQMSRENYRLCAATNKRLLTVPNAGHGISYMEDKEAYLNAVKSFLQSVE